MRGAATKPIRALRRRAPPGCGPQARWLRCSLLTYRTGYCSSLASRQRAWGPAAKCPYYFVTDPKPELRTKARELERRGFMSSTLVGPEIEAPPETDGGGSGFIDLEPGDDGGRGGGKGRQYDLYMTGVWVFMIPVVMFFVGLTSAMIVRKGISDDWISTRLPGILGLNTAVLLASSVTFEMARRAMKEAADNRVRGWVGITAALGTLFLAGQLLAWKQLAAQGVFVGTNPSSSFFYILTATHGIHLLGGMTALLYLTIRILRRQFSARRRSALKATAVYWHFMDALWIYLLLLLLIFWR